ncbi:Dihydroneopterin aldolase 1 [Geodia barretti]|jgi:dihydroneopterin aldolase|uniref:dihydroneopterin aldolase n=2 Tax=Geodia barretti TaxID=519541 RepID=A0AA35TGF6_GEOBA|nr:Dihydroneopterin aldolase 1 [Geodia barretti]
MSLDRIILRGMQFYGFHGVNPEERRLGQPFIVDLEAELDLATAGESDRLQDTVSYTHLYRVVKTVVEGEPRNLLENAASAIARGVFDQHPAVQAVRVRVQKPRPPIRGSVVEAAEVDIYRTRDDWRQFGSTVVTS